MPWRTDEDRIWKTLDSVWMKHLILFSLEIVQFSNNMWIFVDPLRTIWYYWICEFRNRVAQSWVCSECLKRKKCLLIIRNIWNILFLRSIWTNFSYDLGEWDCFLWTGLNSRTRSFSVCRNTIAESVVGWISESENGLSFCMCSGGRSTLLVEEDFVIFCDSYICDVASGVGGVDNGWYNVGFGCAK